MVLLAKFVGTLILILGCTIFITPAFTKKIYAFMKEGKRFAWAGMFRTAVGIVLFLSASQSLLPRAAIALGIMFLMSGLVVFAADDKKLLEFVHNFLEMPAIVIRLMGLFAASFGILIISLY